MAIYEILDNEGNVINRIIAEPDFVEKKYNGLYRDVTPEPELVIEEEKAPVKTLEEKVDELIKKVDDLVIATSIKP